MKKVFLTIIVAFAAAIFSIDAQSQDTFSPSGTYMFAERDTCDLYFNDYLPSKENSILPDGRVKPTILFAFGGGFMMGSKDEKGYMPWFEKLTKDGYRVISIDYRLGLKGVKKMGIAQAELLWDAIHLAVDDLFSATKFIIDNAEALEIDPNNIVICGSSAGAITVLQAEWEICNRMESALVLPEDFNYAGVMSFSGAIFSKVGAIRYKKEPAPTLLFHGTADKLVPYDQIWFFNMRFAGTNVISRTFISNNYNYNIFRFDGHNHEIAGSFLQNYEKEIEFLETNVIGGEKRLINTTIEENGIDIKPFSISKDDLYH